ncbi:MAG: bacterial Ig-like domain-containing protein, partial [Clostridiales bacterium]|nr:bacterial Ig-like domain-containing protein [Clostridiales bacterium]
MKNPRNKRLLKTAFAAAALLAALSAALVLSACGKKTDTLPPPEAVIAGIEVASPPARTRFFLNETFDAGGLIVKAVYDDGSKRVLAPAEYELSAVDTSATGAKRVDVRYKAAADLSAYFDVEVWCGTEFGVVSEQETAFLYESFGTDVWAGPHRSADWGPDRLDEKNVGGYFTYVFDAGGKFNAALLTFDYAFRTVAEVSYDNAAFTEVFTSFAKDSSRFTAEIDLQEKLTGQGGKLSFADNAGTLYVRFRSIDVEPGDGGYGADIFSVGFYYTLSDPSLYRPVSGDPFADLRAFPLTPGTDAETQFLYASQNTGIFDFTAEHGELNGKHARYAAAADASFTYALDAGGAMDEAVLKLDVNNRVKIEASFDGKDYVAVYTKTALQRAIVCLDLKRLAPAAFAGNDGKLFVRFTDPAPAAGNGPTVIGFELCYAPVSEGAYAAPVPVPYMSDYAFSFAFKPGDTDADDYLHFNDGSALWSDEPYYRYNNGDGGSFIYALDFGEPLAGGELKLTIAGVYQYVYVSLDGSAWAEILATDEGSYTPSELIRDLSGISGFAANDGKLYVKFAGKSGRADGNTILYDFYVAYDTESGDEAAVAGIEYVYVSDKKLIEQDAAALSPADGTYLYDKSGNFGGSADSFRFINSEGAYAVYAFDLGNGGDYALTALDLGVEIWGNYILLDASFDGIVWINLLDVDSARDGGGRGQSWSTYDLSAAAGFGANTGVLFVKIYGDDGAGGFGACWSDLRLEYLLDGGLEIEGYPDPAPIEKPTVPTEDRATLELDTADLSPADGDYTCSVSGSIGNWNDGEFWFINSAGAYAVYAFDLGGGGDYALTALDLGVEIWGNYILLDVSFDDIDWINILDVNYTRDGGGRGQSLFTYDLSAAAGFGTNTGVLFVKIYGDDGAGGFGACWSDLRLEYLL